MNDKTLVSQEVAEDAAEWFARLETERPSEKIRHEFVRWLTRSPVHVEEFLRVSALHRALSRELKAEPGWLADVLAEASSPADNVVRMADHEPPPPTERRTAPWHRRAFWAAAAMVVLAVGIGTLVGIKNLVPAGDGGELFATQIGEQRRVVLPDGSGVRLNTDTEILVTMSEELRQVTLVRGEAIFDVEKDPDRPFKVVSDTVLAEAIGTRFNVYRQQKQTVVTVLEGRVAVSSMAAAPPPPQEINLADDGGPEEPTASGDRPTPDVGSAPVELDAGHAVAVTKDGTVAQPAPVDLERATSWTRRRMVFDADTLDTVVTEFNRYNREPIVIADAALVDRRITGVFNIDDPAAFLALLTDLDDIRIEQGADGSREIHRAEATPPG